MAERHHEESKVKMSRRIASVIHRYRIVFLIVGAAVILFPIGYYVVDAIRKSQNEAAAVQNNKLNEKWDAYQGEQDEAKKKVLEGEVLTMIEESAAAFPDKYAGIQARFMRADMNEGKMAEADAAKKKELYLAVLKDLLTIADTAEGNILVPQALMRAAADIQNEDQKLSDDSMASLPEIIALIPGKVLEGAVPADAQDTALIIYRYVTTRYAESLYVPEALITIGFILEKQSKPKEAGEIYSRLESEFATSNWTKIAVNRKIDLENKGVIGN
jgi:hypothetical protein